MPIRHKPELTAAQLIQLLYVYNAHGPTVIKFHSGTIEVDKETTMAEKAALEMLEARSFWHAEIGRYGDFSLPRKGH